MISEITNVLLLRGMMGKPGAGVCPVRGSIRAGGAPTRAALDEELARLLGAPAPTFEMPPADSPAAARASSDKRINPRRLMDELRPALQFPTYREGLASIVSAEAS